MLCSIWGILLLCACEAHNHALPYWPGFHTANDEDSKTVNAMVQRYTEMQGTLALHVIKGDQDYGSVLGNDFMRQHSIARVTVLTHCDNLKRTPDDECKLSKTLDQTSENSSLTFAVDGSMKNDMAPNEEAKKLVVVSQMDSRIEIGAPALADHLEERIREHLFTQYPKALSKLKNCLELTIKRLERKKSQRTCQGTQSLWRTLIIRDPL